MLKASMIVNRKDRNDVSPEVISQPCSALDAPMEFTGAAAASRDSPLPAVGSPV